MGRKNLLLDPPDPKLPAGNSAPAATVPALNAPHLGIMGTRGAVGAVTRSIEKLKEQTVAELRPDLIDPAFVADRLEVDPVAQAALVASIRDSGQQAPILVRPHPEQPGRYQIVYGRRRLDALRELGRSVRAVVKPMTDAQLVVAQGQENSARADLSFIEKALFAARLEERGFDRATIMAALCVDKTGLSRLIAAASRAPRDLLEAIGPAPKAGRDRWLALTAALAAPGRLAAARAAVAAPEFAGRTSDERFAAVRAAAAPARRRPPRPVFWRDGQGARLVRIHEDDKRLTLAVDKAAAGAFGRYLVDRLSDLYADYWRDAAK